MRLHPASCFLLCCLSTSTIVAAQSAPTAQNHKPGEHAPLPKPSNLKVLPADMAIPDLIGVMIGFSQALGVECTHCHASVPGVDPQWELNFASDEKPQKQTARVMMRMVGDLNGKYLAELPTTRQTGAVVCGTCHQGNAHPPKFVPPPAAQAHTSAPPAP